MKKICLSMLMLALLLTGCGGNDEKEVNKNTGKEQLVVAMDTASAPYNYLINAQNDHTVAFGKSMFASGYDVLVARDLAKALKKDLVIKKMKSENFEKALDDGEVDIVISGMLKNKEDDAMAYTSAYYESGLSLVVRKGDKSAAFTELKQFKKLNMIGQKGMLSDAFIDTIKDVKHGEAKANTADLLKALKDKKTDVIVLDTAIANVVVKQNSDVVIVPLKKAATTTKDVVMAMEEGSEDSDLYKSIETFIKGLKKEKRAEYMNLALSSAPAILK